MTEKERFMDRIAKAGAKNFGFTRGTNPNASEDDIYREMNKALDNIEGGNFTVAVLDPE